MSSENLNKKKLRASFTSIPTLFAAIVLPPPNKNREETHRNLVVLETIIKEAMRNYYSLDFHSRDSPGK